MIFSKGVPRNTSHYCDITTNHRPRVRERSKTDVSHSPTKENQPFAANVRDIRPPVADSPDDTLAGGSVNTAYDEYNNRPASSGIHYTQCIIF